MAKRYVLSPIIGSGSGGPANAFRASVGDVSQTNSNAIIPSLSNGHPKFNFAICVVGTLNLPGVLAVSNAYVFPEYPLDARMDGMEPETRTALVQSVEAYDMDGNGLHLVADHADGDSYRAVITSIGQQIEPVFNLNNFDTAEPTP